MSFSFKKKDNDFFTLEESQENSENKKTVNNSSVSHSALTPDEVLSGFNTEKPSNLKELGALESLKKRIANMAAQTETAVENEDVSESVMEDFIENMVNERKSYAQQSEKTEDSPKENSETSPETNTVKESEIKDTAKIKKTSLLDKCLPYITDDDGNEADLNAEPLYKLQSVAEILKSDSEKALERLSEKYDIEFDDLGHSPYIKEEIKPEPIESDVPAQKKVPLVKTEPETEKQTFEEKIQVKSFQSNVKSIISDIDTPHTTVKPVEAPDISNTATITFTPINDGDKNGPKLRVSSQTRPIDLTGELAKLPEIETENEELHLEKNDFEDFAPNEELSADNVGKFIRKYSIKKRNAFLGTVFSVILTLILAIFKLPFMTQLTLSHTMVTMIICAAITGIIIMLNGSMFLSFKNIFSCRSSPDICAALASLTVVAYSVFGIITENIITDILLLLSVILCVRMWTSFFKASYMLSNIKHISSPNRKNAVRLVNDPAITFAMAKNSIEGDVLIAVPQKAEFIEDFMKHSEFGVFFGGKLPLLTVLSVILSVILGFTCANYFDGIVHGFYAAAAIQCFTALPTAFFIDTLPLYRASKKLNRKGGMIARKTGAEYTEMANAIVLDSADLFPAGTITLHQMKVLSDNNLEDTIIRAASLTESLNSSLAPIFKRIAGTGNITTLPDSDTVKYEDRMGISGWVDNRLLFIGNRTLMEAHGIEVPPIEVDRRILRNGFFPVYVATRDKACALLIIQYNVDREVARELRRLTSSGVTLLLNSCDPNLVEEMICDYFGLYPDSVKVMSAAGCHMYKSAVSPVKTVSAPAVFKNNPLALVSIINCAAKIKKSNILLNVMYVLTAVLGAMIFAYTSLSGSGELLRDSTVLLYGILSSLLSYLLYLFTRP